MDERDFLRFTLNQIQTLEAAMLAIENNQHRSIIVLNDAGVVVGTLSDGDIRKAILAHRILSTPIHQVMNTNFIALTPETRSEANAIFQREHIFLIPVIDNRGRLLDILTNY